MSSRLNNKKQRNDSEDFPLLVDDDDDLFHDSSQICGMELGGNTSLTTSSSLLQMFNESYQGPSQNELDLFYNEREQLFCSPSPAVPQHVRRRCSSDDLEDLYSFSMSDDDDVLMDYHCEVDYLQTPQQHGSDLGMDNNEVPLGTRGCIGGVNNTSTERPRLGDSRFKSNYYPPSQRMLIASTEAQDPPEMDSALAPLQDDQRIRTIRFADEEQEDSSKLLPSTTFASERSMTIDDFQDKHLDIFDQGSSSMNNGSASYKSSSLFEDTDEDMSDDDFEDEGDEEEDLERRILKTWIYSGATMAVVAGLGYVSKKVMSAFQKQDDVDAGNGVDHAMNETADEAAHTAGEAGVEAGIEAGGSVNNGTVNNGAVNNVNNGAEAGGSQANSTSQQQ
jgi:hypothetical protein